MTSVQRKLLIANAVLLAGLAAHASYRGGNDFMMYEVEHDGIREYIIQTIREYRLQERDERAGPAEPK